MAILAAALGSAAIAAAGGIASSAMSRPGPRDTGESEMIARNQLQQASNNDAYNRAVNALTLQTARAGYSDSSGSSMRYDPTTNTWVSALGPDAQAAQRAERQAGISRNTDDRYLSQLTNVSSAQRAALADRMAQGARTELANFRPQSSDELAGLLQTQTVNASNQVMEPARADILRSFARQGTAAAPVISSLENTNLRNLRDTIMQSRIGAIENTDKINQSRRGELLQNYAGLSGLANPQFQYSGIQGNDDAKTLASITSGRMNYAPSQTGAGLAAINQGTANTQAATNKLLDSLANPNFEASKLAGLSSQIGSAGQQGLDMYMKYKNNSGGSGMFGQSKTGYNDVAF